MIVESLFSSINRGREGLNAGLSTGLSKLDGLVYGIQRRWMEVVAGDSGSIINSTAVYISNYMNYYRAKSVKTETLMPR